MSVYNAEKYLEDSVNSILNQTYKNFEFIIINDGSFDNSKNILKEYAITDKRIILIQQKNHGLTVSLNIGIRCAKGDYIARQDADDISHENRFKNFVSYIEKNGGIDFYSTPAFAWCAELDDYKIIPNYLRRNGFSQKMLNYHNSLIHGTLIIRATLLKKHLYNESYSFSQDFELYHRLMSSGYKLCYDNSNLTYTLRLHNLSISKIKKDTQKKLFKNVLRENSLNLFYIPYLSNIYFRFIDVFYFIKTKFL